MVNMKHWKERYEGNYEGNAATYIASVHQSINLDVSWDEKCLSVRDLVRRQGEAGTEKKNWEKEWEEGLIR